jgi:endonuclease/exonuclease/phosphatase family metal-dependent hydrolase
VPILVRSWNLFHGNAKPPERRAFLEEMVRLASEDRPDVLCLQEVPIWALARLAGWSGMQAFGDVAAPARFGPFPGSVALGRRLTELDHGFLRSAFTGQANAILLTPEARVVERQSLVLNSAPFRRAQARWLGLTALPRLAWAKERRICQVVRAVLPDGRGLVVANLHATGYDPDRRLADAEILRAAVFADGLSEPDDVCLLCGDFNVEGDLSRTLRDLATPEWGFSPAGSGIDHVLARGAVAGEARRWPTERRTVRGRVLSDHAPLEVAVA